jgi:hypothetical protein
MSGQERMTNDRNGGDQGFEAELFKAADSLRGNLEPSEYKHIVLGLIFLKYISEAFETQRAKLQQEQYADPNDPEEDLAARVFWVSFRRKQCSFRYRSLLHQNQSAGLLPSAGIYPAIQHALLSRVAACSGKWSVELLPKNPLRCWTYSKSKLCL